MGAKEVSQIIKSRAIRNESIDPGIAADIIYDQHFGGKPRLSSEVGVANLIVRYEQHGIPAEVIYRLIGRGHLVL